MTSTRGHSIRDGARLLRRRRRYLASALAVIAAAALVGNAAFNAALAIANARRVTAADASVIHTHEVLEALQRLQRALHETESRQRGFLLTGDQRYLEQYEAARAALDRYLVHVVELTGDNPAQQQHMDVLRPLIATRLDLLEQGVRLRKSAAFDATRLMPLMDEAQRLMVPAGEEFREMYAVENGLLQDRVRSSMMASRRAVVTSLLGLAGSIAVVIGALWLLDRRAREVARSKSALQAVLGALPDAVVVVADGRVAAMNTAAEELFRKSGRAPPKDVGDLVALAAPSTRLQEALQGRQPLDSVDLDMAVRVAVGGETRRILPRTVPLALGDENSGVLLVLSDVTELARVDEMRSDLVAAASHELRTPVTTLRMSLLMLREEGAGCLAPRTRDLVETALVGVQQLLETVDELLDMTRIEAGRLRLSPEPLQLGDVVREVAARSRGRAEELGLRLQVDAQEGELAVLADRARLRIVVDNIVNNALKYTPRGGTIDVRVSSRPDGASGDRRVVELAVTDTGRGIPEEFRSRVFEKFFRVEHYRPGCEDEPRGAGVGLYLCKEIVELHGGTIRCEAAPGRRGTRIVVALPAGEASSGYSLPPATVTPAPSRPGSSR